MQREGDVVTPKPHAIFRAALAAVWSSNVAHPFSPAAPASLCTLESVPPSAVLVLEPSPDELEHAVKRHKPVVRDAHFIAVRNIARA
jgi:hypothetical protein